MERKRDTYVTEFSAVYLKHCRSIAHIVFTYVAFYNLIAFYICYLIAFYICSLAEIS